VNYEEAEALCEEFARKHEIQFVRYGTCGFGRDCSGFSKDGTWIAYHPRKAYYEGPAALNPHKWDPVPEFNKVRMDPPPEVTDAYHKDDYLCVLHHTYDEDYFTKVFGKDTQDVIIDTPDREKPRTPQMESAVIQLAKWVINMEKNADDHNSKLFVGIFNNGYRGMQAMFTGTHNPAIGVL
jgi:hypothetical protein